MQMLLPCLATEVSFVNELDVDVFVQVTVLSPQCALRVTVMSASPNAADHVAAGQSRFFPLDAEASTALGLKPEVQFANRLGLRFMASAQFLVNRACIIARILPPPMQNAPN